MTAVVSDTSERAVLQQRVLRVLALGQVVGGAALASAVTIGAFVVPDLLGHDTPWAGTATSVTTTGTAFMSRVLARKMSRQITVDAIEAFAAWIRSQHRPTQYAGQPVPAPAFIT